MLELLKTSVTGANVIPTTFLGLVVLYWLVVVVGALDIDFLDFDVDADTGSFLSILAFLNFGKLPFMLVFSIIVLIFWVFSMFMHLLPIETGGLINGILLLPILVISVFLSKIITQPLKRLFNGVFSADEKEYTPEGKLCTLLCDLTRERLGQAEISGKNASIVINVKTDDNDYLLKGDKALVIKKDANKDFYLIKKFESVR